MMPRFAGTLAANLSTQRSTFYEHLVSKTKNVYEGKSRGDVTDGMAKGKIGKNNRILEAR